MSGTQLGLEPDLASCHMDTDPGEMEALSPPLDTLHQGWSYLSHLHNVDLDCGYRSFISKELRPLFLPFCFSYALNRQSLCCLISFSYHGLDKSKIHDWLYLYGTLSASIFWCYPILPPKQVLKWTWKLRQNIWHQVDPVAGKITIQQ